MFTPASFQRLTSQEGYEKLRCLLLFETRSRDFALKCTNRAFELLETNDMECMNDVVLTQWLGGGVCTAVKISAMCQMQKISFAGPLNNLMSFVAWELPLLGCSRNCSIATLS